MIYWRAAVRLIGQYWPGCAKGVRQLPVCASQIGYLCVSIGCLVVEQACNPPGCRRFSPQAQASEAMEVFDELMETEVSIIVQHLSEVVGFCLEVSMMHTGLLASHPPCTQCCPCALEFRINTFFSAPV